MVLRHEVIIEEFGSEATGGAKSYGFGTNVLYWFGRNPVTGYGTLEIGTIADFQSVAEYVGDYPPVGDITINQTYAGLSIPETWSWDSGNGGILAVDDHDNAWVSADWRLEDVVVLDTVPPEEGIEKTFEGTRATLIRVTPLGELTIVPIPFSTNYFRGGESQSNWTFKDYFNINSGAWDPYNQRIIFATRGMSWPIRRNINGEQLDESNGIWAYDPAAETFEMLLYAYGVLDEEHYTGFQWYPVCTPYGDVFFWAAQNYQEPFKPPGVPYSGMMFGLARALVPGDIPYIIVDGWGMSDEVDVSVQNGRVFALFPCGKGIRFLWVYGGRFGDDSTEPGAIAGMEYWASEYIYNGASVVESADLQWILEEHGGRTPSVENENDPDIHHRTVMSWPSGDGLSTYILQDNNRLIKVTGCAGSGDIGWGKLALRGVGSGSSGHYEAPITGGWTASIGGTHTHVTTGEELYDGDTWLGFELPYYNPGGDEEDERFGTSIRAIRFTASAGDAHVQIWTEGLSYLITEFDYTGINLLFEDIHWAMDGETEINIDITSAGGVTDPTVTIYFHDGSSGVIPLYSV
jgi:hypothetical protein